MKFIRLKSVNWMVAMALLALPGALVTSCSKESSPTENVEPKSDQLVISVKGINNQKASAPLRQGLPSKGKAQAAKVVPTVHEFGDVDMAVSVGNDLPVKSSVNFASRKGGVAGLRADVPETAVAMEEGLKYVVYIYEGTTFVKSIELAAGTAGTIEGLNPEGQYTWVALSYSSEENVPDLVPGTDIELPLNQDVLYAKGTVDLSTASTIEILFDHVYSRIGIELNTIGVFGEITGTPQISVTDLNVAAGSLNLLDGSLTPGATTGATLSWEDFQRIDPAYGDQMIAYVYTAPLAEQAATLNIQNLSISHVDNVSGSVSRTFFTTPANFALNVEPEAGSSHHLLFNVVESPLTTTYGGRTVRWGRSNLYYRNNGDPLRNYAFYATNGQTARADGYFGFGGTVPGTFATAATEGDPCALVYPAGLWKQPANEDFNNMINSSGTLSNVLGSLLGAVIQLPGAPNATLGSNYIQYTATSPGGAGVFGDEGNNLRFYFNGHINEVAALTQLGNGGGLLGLGLNDLSVSLLDQSVLDLGINVLDSYGDLTALWTHDQALNLLGLVGAGTWGYIAIPVDPLIGANYIPARKTAELLNGVSALGIDVLSTTLKNVRCVRAPQPTQ